MPASEKAKVAPVPPPLIVPLLSRLLVSKVTAADELLVPAIVYWLSNVTPLISVIDTVAALMSPTAPLVGTVVPPITNGVVPPDESVSEERFVFKRPAVPVLVLSAIDRPLPPLKVKAFWEALRVIPPLFTVSAPPV